MLKVYYYIDNDLNIIYITYINTTKEYSPFYLVKMQYHFIYLW